MKKGMGAFQGRRIAGGMRRMAQGPQGRLSRRQCSCQGSAVDDASYGQFPANRHPAASASAALLNALLLCGATWL